ncbi:bromodomain and WD repeat-containing protein 1 isoform X2 [Manduca sexta]|uniref:bromodomain and WD repeat-containing protein 1 isoform X2 n=1 Tax=Manduca sexta TaxID=7130 RepID=UPI00188E4C6F|nr:bromodomain and WD repeat-containing protein 1 isoform X2 [Manduca sexta]
MEESNDEHNVVPELYFLIAKFLCGGPLKETAKTLLKELESVEVLPRRLDWEGAEHAQSYRELAAQYSDISWQRLATVCERALRLARVAPSVAQDSETQGAAVPSAEQSRLTARLSLLSETLVRPKPKYSFFKQDHSLVRRLVHRELGLGGAATAGGRGGEAAFPARLLSGLQLQRRTLGHLSAVYCVVFDCTGRYVVTGADDLLVKVWVARDGRLAATLRGCGAEVTDVCVSRDGALLAVGSVERLVRVWCLATGAPRAVLHAHAGTITSVHWSPATRGEVRWLASTSTDGSVAFWSSSADGQFLSQPVQYVERMRPGACHMICAAWSAGGAFLAAGSADQHVRVYALHHTAPTPRRVLEVAVHGDAVDSIAWAHRGLRFVSGSKDGSAALWTLHATQWRHAMLVPADKQRAADGKRLKVTMVCWDCSDAYVVTAVSDNTVRVWCSRTCMQVRCLSGHRDEAYVLEAHPFLPAVLLSAGHDGQLFVWDAAAGEVLAQFHNRIEGQGDGAIFDAKWGGGATIAATDSHGHLLLLGLGRGHRLLSELPAELFFHTDYRPLVRDALGGALDEQTETPPHLMPPPFLVDVEGAPHAPRFQRLVPGRENLALNQLIPAADAPRSRIDAMIAELAGGGGGPGGLGGLGGEARGVWRGEGVRHTAGSWQRGDPLLVPHSTRPIVPPLAPAARRALEQACAELNALEMSWYRREMRRRPVMISTATDSASGRRRPGPRARAPRAARPPPARPPPPRVEEEPPESASHSDTSDESVRLSGSAHSSRDRSSFASSLDLTDSSTSSDSSEYSDWETGAALAPPARARRRPLPARRYSPSTSTNKRTERPSTSAAADGASGSGGGEPAEADAVDGDGEGSASGTGAGAAADDLPDVYRPGEWLTAVAPRKAPYHPQMGDMCLYFRVGHQRYFEAVAVKDLYKINQRDKPWERTQVHECELAKVVGVRYEIKPPRVASVRLACALDAGRPRSLTVRYHDMPDVIDFLVLRQQYDAAVARRWGPGDRFRCMIDDSWWSGVVLERCPTAPRDAEADPRPSVADSAAERFSREAASHFLSLRVRWDNGEVERLSPWDLEPVDPTREPTEPGGSVAVLPRELETALYRAEAHEWPPRGNRAAACHAIALHIGQVMSLSVAEPFVAPVDLQLYPTYARVVPYPIDLATIKARFENLFYRRMAAAQFDVRYLATNAELFNEARSPIVRQARLLTDLLLYIISHWHEVDVVAKYHELAASYQSSDDEPLAPSRKSRRAARRRSGAAESGTDRAGDKWRAACSEVLRSLLASADAEPFLAPVSESQAPDYARVVARPMDLGTVGARLAAGRYSTRDHFAADVRQVFSNSRLYNTNKRSRIYSMTVRLSSLFEALWARVPAPRGARGARGARRARPTHSGRTSPRRTRHRTHRTHRTRRVAAAELANGHESASSDSETLAATSRRVHRAAADAAAADDSLDSDAPLDAHRKGKGVGKKSKSSSASVEPAPSTSRARDTDLYVPSGSRTVRDESGGEGGGGSWSESSAYSNIEVVEEELAEDEVELTYDEHSDGPHRTSTGRNKRKRARITSGSSEGGRVNSHRPDNTPLKRMRERFTANTTTSGSSSGSELEEDRARRYESDHSYRPRYSTDDDAPLNLYRQRQSGASATRAADEPGTSGTAGSRREHNGHARVSCGGVSLRARSPVRYNEDSEEDSAAAISKRAQRPHRVHRLPRALTNDLRTQASVGVGLSGAGPALVPHNDDHNYFNGHAAPHHHRHPVSSRSTGGRSGGEGSSGGAAPVSISSRGRVRKLTAKARGLLRD